MNPRAAEICLGHQIQAATPFQEAIAKVQNSGKRLSFAQDFARLLPELSKDGRESLIRCGRGVL